MTKHIIRNPEVYFGFCQTSMIGHFAKTVTGLCQSLFFNIVASLRPPTKLKKRIRHKPVTIFVKSSMIDVC